MIHNYARCPQGSRAFCISEGYRDVLMKLDDRRFQVMLSQLKDRDIKIAAVWALNDTAKDVLEHQQARMERVFDRPTRFTKNAFMVWKAKPNTLEASVIERPSVKDRHFLKVQEFGGARGQTGTEGLLGLHVNYDGVLQSVVPAEHARLDAYGNWSAGERNQVLSALGAQRDKTSNTPTKLRRAERSARKYFVPKTGLAPGVYRRDGPGDAALRVLKFTAVAPKYQPLLGFYDGAEDVYRAKLPEHLSRTIAKMVSKRAGAG